MKPLLLGIILAAAGPWSQAAGSTTESLTELAERAKSASTGTEINALVEPAFRAEDIESVGILLNYPGTKAGLTDFYQKAPASAWKDHLTVFLLIRPWEFDQPVPSRRDQLRPDAFWPYAAYMRQRLGFALVDPDSPEQLLKAGASLEGRTAIAREFEGELVKAGLATEDDRTLPKAATPVASARPRKDPRSNLAASDGSEAKENGEKKASISMSKWIAVASAVLLAAAAYFSFRRKAAKA